MTITTLSHYAQLLRLHKPIGILLLLWPTLIALWIAGAGKPDAKLVCVFVMGVIVMRSAGCIINDIADQKWDGQVSRTRHRPLVTQQVSHLEAYGLFALLLGIACILALQLNYLSFLLSIVSLALATVYPFMKRITHLPQMILGFAFSMAIPMAFAAQLDTIPPLAWLLTLANISWVMAYDTQYAMVDREDDLKIGIKSSAILFGRADRWMILILQSLALSIFWMLGSVLKFNAYYYGGILIAGLLSVYQFVLIFNRDPARCFQAFLNNNLLGATLFLGVFLSYTTQ